jgi:uncharacterized protein (TIGR02246 family)
MRRLICLLVLLAATGTHAAEPPAHPALGRWADAWSSNDPATLAALYAPCAQVWTPEARVQATGRAAIADAVARAAEDQAARSLAFGHHRWLEHGSLAVASGVALVHLVGQDGTAMPMALRFSMVWRSDGRDWKIIDEHLSLLEFDDD